MSEVAIRQLFHESRLPGGWRRLPLLIYAPLGLVLSVIRLFIGVQALLAATILSPWRTLRSVALRVMTFVLGFIVHYEGFPASHKAKLLLSNHVTALDAMALHLLTGCIALSEPDEPALVSHALGFHSIGQISKRMVAESTSPFLIFPEGTTTNGLAGILKFASWPLEMGAVVQPVAVRVWRPPPSLNPSTLGSSWWGDLFALLFSPFTVYSIRFLPELELTIPPESEEPVSQEIMARKLQCDIAHELQLVATSYTTADKEELLKRLASPRPSSRSFPSSPSRQAASSPHRQAKVQSDLARWVQQVKEVLPQVAQDVILRDLVVTGSVDLTIANLLELESAQPEPNKFVAAAAEPLPPSPAPTQCKVGQVSLDTAACSFGRTAQERMLSFQERKSRLIASARQHYIEKHGLQPEDRKGGGC